MAIPTTNNNSPQIMQPELDMVNQDSDVIAASTNLDKAVVRYRSVSLDTHLDSASMKKLTQGINRELSVMPTKLKSVTFT